MTMLQETWICTECNATDPPQGSCKLIVIGTEDDLSQNRPKKCPYRTFAQWWIMSEEEINP